MTCNDCPNQTDEAAFVREMQHAEMIKKNSEGWDGKTPPTATSHSDAFNEE